MALHCNKYMIKVGFSKQCNLLHTLNKIKSKTELLNKLINQN